MHSFVWDVYVTVKSRNTKLSNQILDGMMADAAADNINTSDVEILPDTPLVNVTFACTKFTLLTSFMSGIIKRDYIFPDNSASKIFKRHAWSYG